MPRMARSVDAWRRRSVFVSGQFTRVAFPLIVRLLELVTGNAGSLPVWGEGSAARRMVATKVFIQVTARLNGSSKASCSQPPQARSPDLFADLGGRREDVPEAVGGLQTGRGAQDGRRVLCPGDAAGGAALQAPRGRLQDQEAGGPGQRAAAVDGRGLGVRGPAGSLQVPAAGGARAADPLRAAPNQPHQAREPAAVEPAAGRRGAQGGGNQATAVARQEERRGGRGWWGQVGPATANPAA